MVGGAMPERKNIPGSPDEIESAFYDALNRADIDALMRLWADEDDIVCIHPGAQRLVGHTAIRAVWQEILSHGPLAIRPRKIHTSQNLLTAVHSLIEDVAQGHNAPTDMHIVATNVYMHTAQGWKIVLHHASICPGAAPTELAPFSILH
jgi:ketosteroid isomerase-like protein